jgi:hypothetical protein
MKIDRARFLVLTSTLAAGCGPAGAPTSPTNNAANTANTGEVDAGPVTPTTSTSEGGMIGKLPTGEGSYPTGEGTYPTGEGYYPTGEGGGGYMAPPKKPTPAPICGVNELAGKPGSCASLKIDKSCAPFPFVNSACSDALKYYKPKIAERAVSCIHSRTPKQLCDAMSVYDCKDYALHTACPDASSDASCAAIQQSCKTTTLTECRTYLSGMNDLGRAEMVKCMAQNCSWGLYSCAEGL